MIENFTDTDLVISASFHPYRNAWLGMAVIMSESGTHDNYNVIYNGECSFDWAKSEQEAKQKAKNAYDEYLYKKAVS